jgi:signal peptidase II
MPKRSYRWLFVALAVVGLCADQATKYGVFRWLYDGSLRGEREVVEGWFKLTAEFTDAVQPCDCAYRGLQTWSAPRMPRVNHGALFGLGGQHEGGANHLFAAVSILAAVGILVWATRSTTAPDGWLSAALGLILGGTVGNLYDRVVFNGVRDFLYFYHEIDVWVWQSKEGWPVFNVADCCLVAGAGMLLTHAFLFQPKTEPKAVKTESTPATVG